MQAEFRHHYCLHFGAAMVVLSAVGVYVGDGLKPWECGETMNSTLRRPTLHHCLQFCTDTPSSSLLVTICPFLSLSLSLSFIADTLPSNNYHSDKTLPGDLRTRSKIYTSQPLLPPTTVIMLTILFVIIIKWHEAYHNQEMGDTSIKQTKQQEDKWCNSQQQTINLDEDKKYYATMTSPFLGTGRSAPYSNNTTTNNWTFVFCHNEIVWLMTCTRECIEDC